MLVYSSCIADIVDTVLIYCEITITHSYRFLLSFGHFNKCTYLQRTFAVYEIDTSIEFICMRSYVSKILAVLDKYICILFMER